MYLAADIQTRHIIKSCRATAVAVIKRRLGPFERTVTTTMPFIEKPHFTLRVEQTKSTFAEGNARW
jgi:hypothetical protein